MDGCINGCIDRWINGWTGGWISQTREGLCKYYSMAQQGVWLPQPSASEMPSQKQNKPPIIWNRTGAKLINFHQEIISSANSVKTICILGEYLYSTKDMCWVLLCARHCSKHLRYIQEQNKDTCPQELIFWWRRKIININIINILIT